MDNELVISKFQSGDNSVELHPQEDKYTVVSNGAPVFSSKVLPEALGRYYREISAINSAQQSGLDLSMHLFGDEVVRLNRMIIPKLAMMGRPREVKYIEALNKAIQNPLKEAMEEFFKNTDDQVSTSVNIFKYEPVGAVPPAAVPSTSGDELQNAGAGETVTPRRLELKRGRKIDENTVELKSINGMQPFPEEDKMNDPIERAVKVKSTYQMKNHPKNQRSIDGTVIEPVYIKKSRVARDEAFDLGEKVGVNFNKVEFDDWMEGLRVEHEHKDIVHDDHEKIAKIALAHLEEDPKYYKKLKKYVEKSVSKDFAKMEEGDQAHENMEHLEGPSIGSSQEPIDGEPNVKKKMEKAAFSMDAPKQEIMKKPAPIEHPIDSMMKAEGWSKEEADYQGETSNNNSYAKQVRMKKISSLDRKGAGGDDVRDGHDALFQYSLTSEQTEKILKLLAEENNA